MLLVTLAMFAKLSGNLGTIGTFATGMEVEPENPEIFEVSTGLTRIGTAGVVLTVSFKKREVQGSTLGVAADFKAADSFEILFGTSIKEILLGSASDGKAALLLEGVFKRIGVLFGKTSSLEEEASEFLAVMAGTMIDGTAADSARETDFGAEGASSKTFDCFSGVLTTAVNLSA